MPLKKISTESLWLSHPIQVDGKLLEWPTDMQFYNSNTELAYTIANDSSNLYLCFQVFDELMQMKILKAGMVVSVDTNGKKKEHIIIQYPQKPLPYIVLAEILEDQKDYQRALEVLKKAVKTFPQDASIHFRLGVIYDKMQSKDMCIKEMRQTISLDPNHAEALNYLGYTYAEMGENLDEAEKLIKKALEIKPEDGYIIDSLGWVYYQKGQYKKALEILKKAHKLASKDPIITEHLGDVYSKNGLYQEALKYYRQALKLKPDNPENILLKIKKLEQILEKNS